MLGLSTSCGGLGWTSERRQTRLAVRSVLLLFHDRAASHDEAGLLPQQFGAWFAHARLGAAAAPARAPGEGAGGEVGAAHRADRRRQDARGLSAEPGGALAERGPTRPGEPVIGPHTLYISPLKALAVDIAPQPRGAGRGDGAADPAGDAHRRYAASTSGSARNSIRPTSCSRRPSRWRCCSPPRTRGASSAAQDGDLRRAAFAGRLEARRPAGARPRAPPAARARAEDDRPLRDCRRARRLCAWLVAQEPDEPRRLADKIVVGGRRAA